MMTPDFYRALRWAPLGLALCVLGAVILEVPGRHRTPLPPPPTQSATGNEPLPEALALADLTDWSLFGRAAAADEETTGHEANSGNVAGDLPAESIVLPTTTLDVQVRGLAYATVPGRAHAILQVNGQAQQRYKPGDVLTDGVTLAGVRPLEIVISNQGRMESAALPMAPADLAIPPVSVLPAAAAPTVAEGAPNRGWSAFGKGGDTPDGELRTMLTPPPEADTVAPNDESVP